jgi:hypothetical protein
MKADGMDLGMKVKRAIEIIEELRAMFPGGEHYTRNISLPASVSQDRLGEVWGEYERAREVWIGSIYASTAYQDEVTKRLTKAREAYLAAYKSAYPRGAQ